VAYSNQKERRVSFDEITPFLKDCYSREPDIYVALYADESIPYKEVVKILDIANQNNFKMILVTRPK
jgi:biopolymer transport protein ExbD